MSRRIFVVLAAMLFLGATSALAHAADGDRRLARDVVPTLQSIRLRLDADKRSYSGTIRAELRVVRATNTFALHSEGQKLGRVTLLQGADSVAVERRTSGHGLLTLQAARPLQPGTATLEIEFTHLYGSRAVGLYRVVRDGHGYLFTQFESDDAREAFPCWDEPSFKFPYQLTLEVPVAHEVLSNTPIQSSTAREGWKTVVFERTPPLPSYLLALATGPFEFVPVPGTRIPTRIVTVQGQKSLAATAAQVTPRLLEGLERWFGTPYPFAKLDLLAVPEFAYGAMENPGAITFRDDNLLIDPGTSTVSQRRSSANVICHELAHMWFGDLVTMEWWDDLWLNESFANWMAAKVTDEVFPEFKQGLNDLQRQQETRNSDALPSTRAIRDTTTGASEGLVNVGLVYNKGNAMLAMFENWLGPDVFQRGVRQYLKEHAWGNATAADLWRALDAASGSAVSVSMATFTDQGGVPIVRLTPTPAGVRLAQSRCTPWGVEQAERTWSIPVSLRWSDGTTTRVQRTLLGAGPLEVKLAGARRAEWVMPNAGGRGYYAWSVPDSMLERMAAMAGSAMTPAERVAFLGNLGMLLAAGEVRGDTYLRVLSYFRDDAEPQVLAGVVNALARVRAAFVPDSAAAPFARYVRLTLGPALERIGFERRAGEDEVNGAIRGELLSWMARRGGDERAAAFADRATQRYLADSTSVDPGIVEAVLELSAQHGDVALYDELRRRSESATVPAMRRRFLGTLGAFEDPALEARALRYMLSDSVHTSESMLVMMGFRDKGEAAGEKLFHWMMEHYADIAARIPPPALRFLPMMGSGCSEERLRATQAFFRDPAHEMPGVESTLARVADQVHGCLSLREREGKAVVDYLNSLGAK